MNIHSRLWALGLSGLSAASCAGLGANEENFAEVPSGSSLEATLDRGVSTKQTRAGQAISASLTTPILAGQEVVLPAGAVLRGTVTAISKTPPSMTVAFTDLEAGDLRLVVSTHPTTVRLAEDSEMTSEGAKIGGGAAAGAVLGGVIGGNVKGAAIGAAAGAAAGTGVALATKNSWAYLPRGATLHIRLSAPLSVPLGPTGEDADRKTT